jgi:hypothetical protein
MGLSHKRLPAGGLFFCAALLCSSALAAPLQGSKQLVLHAVDGAKVKIGQVQFTPQSEGASGFSVQLDYAVFTDHFLSMREFKCLSGATEILCHVPYPYTQRGTVRENDLAWLEHALLFMFKKPSDFGAKLWNGVYWKLRVTAAGLEGVPQAVDLNLISAPPARSDVPPYKPALRDDMAPGARWFVRMTLE